MVNRALLKTETFSKPIVAAVNGACLGGGIELLLATDVRYAVPQARFGLPEVKWAIYPFGGAASKLVLQLGYVHAMKLLLTADAIDADEAVCIGLVNEIVPAEGAQGPGGRDGGADRVEQPAGGAGGEAVRVGRAGRAGARARGAGAVPRRRGPGQP